jgi:hypothetical protein
MSVFKKDDLEKRVEVLEKKVKELYKIIGKPPKVEEEVVNEEDEYCVIS